jgi:hypothetical protein
MKPKKPLSDSVSKFLSRNAKTSALPEKPEHNFSEEPNTKPKEFWILPIHTSKSASSDEAEACLRNLNRRKSK